MQQQGSDEDTEDNGSECVICMCDVRDTLILPCRHLCLCNGCADSLRYQANNCPICRAPFRALLQIKALQKAIGTIISNPPLPEVSTRMIKLQHFSYFIMYFARNFSLYFLVFDVINQRSRNEKPIRDLNIHFVVLFIIIISIWLL